MSRAPDGSTLSLDFTAMGALDPRITFSRADATARATFINSQGYVTTVATAQAPRFDFDPTTLVPKGLLIEAPATNIIRGSQTIAGTEWSSSTPNFTVTLNTTDLVAPNNTNTATKLVYVSGYARAVQTSITVVPNTTYTFSYWIKSTGGCFWKIYNASGGSFIIQDIAIFASANWQRITQTFTTPAGCTEIWAYVADSAGAGTYYVWGAQIELGSQASSYIATTTASITRAADTALMTGTNFSSWYTGDLTGTFVTEWFYGATSTAANTVIATCDVARQHLHQYVAATTGRLRLANKVPVIIETANAITNNAINEGAFSYQASIAQSLCLNGGTVATGAFVHSENPTWFSIGGVSSNGTSITDITTMLNNSIRKIKYFPTRLSDAQIKAISTL